jgi:tol-pal system protein YbgF
LNDGIYPLAEKHFRAVLKSPASEKEAADVTVLLARALHAQEQYDEVINVLQEYWKFGESAGALPAFTFWLGKAYYDAGRPDDALLVLRRLKSDAVDEAYVNRCSRLQARCLIRNEQYIDGLTIFNQTEKHFAKKADPDAAHNYLDWASTLIQLDRGIEAKEILYRMTQVGDTTNPTVQQGMMWLAKLRLVDQQYEDAQLILKELTLAEGVEPLIKGEAWFVWAELYDATGSAGEATKALVKAEEFFTDKKQLARIRIQRAKLLVKRGELNEGAELLRGEIPAVSDEITAAEAQLFLAQAQLDEELFEDAENAFQAYLEAYPLKQDIATSGKAWSLMGLKRYAEAAAAFEKVAHTSEDPELKRQALLKTADAHYANAQYEQAHQVYKTFARSYPGSDLLAQALFQGAMCLLKQEKRSAAEQEFRKVIAVFPESQFAERSYLQFAYLLQDKGLWSEAEQAYTDYLGAYPNANFEADALLNRGLARYYLVKFEDAHEDFKGIVDRYADSPLAERAYFMRGWCLYMLRREPEAIQVCNEFLKAYPETSWADDVLFWLAEFYWNKKIYDKAEERFKNITVKYPSAQLAPNAFFWAGRSAFEQKEFDRAIEFFSSVAKNYPEHDLVPEALFYEGDAFTEKGRFSAAILVFEQIIKDYPNSWLVYHAWGRKGDCERTEGQDNPERYQEALKSWRTIIDAQDATVELKLKTHFRIAGTYTVLGESQAALEHYLEAFYMYLDNRDKLGASAVNYFTRSGFLAADTYIDAGEPSQARNIYRRIIQSGVPAAEEAEKRLNKSYYLKELTK